jgi:drug/metabolite transporter (DMT)-like permease
VERDPGGQLSPPARSGADGIDALPAVAAAAGFGLLGVFSKLAYSHGAGVSGVVAGRSVFMVPMLAVLWSPARRRQARDAAPELTAMAALMVFNAVTYFTAIARMSPAAVTLIVYLYPAIVVAASSVLARARLRVAAVLAAGLSLAGVALILGRPEGIDSVGAACAAANAAGYAAYLIVSERALRRSDPVTAFAVCGGVAGAFLLAGGLAVAVRVGLHDAFGGVHATVAIAGAGVISTVAAGTLQLVAVRRLGSAPTALITCLEIVVVVMASAALFAEPITIRLMAGALLVSAGAALAPSVLRPSPVAARACV